MFQGTIIFPLTFEYNKFICFIQNSIKVISLTNTDNQVNYYETSKFKFLPNPIGYCSYLDLLLIFYNTKIEGHEFPLSHEKSPEISF